MEQPLVTIICVCYNQVQFVAEALNSVINQTYKPIELIIIDDASTDGSQRVIAQWTKAHPQTQVLYNNDNLGYCKTFNKALKFAKGDFVMDLSADDVLVNEKISVQIDLFLQLDTTYGVVFSDAEYIDASGTYIRDHFQYLFRKGLLKTIPQGNVYTDVLDKYFIPAPSMLSRAEVFNRLGGYDEELAYEDFDYWVRSSRLYKYAYVNKKLIRIRRSSQSMSVGWYKRGDQQLMSTYKICRKAMTLNNSERDWHAWSSRVRYELRQSVLSDNRSEAKLFFDLLKERRSIGMMDRVFYILHILRLPLSGIRTVYHKLRYD